MSDIMMKEVVERLTERGITMSVTDAFKEKLLGEVWCCVVGVSRGRLHVPTVSRVLHSLELEGLTTDGSTSPR